MLMSIKELNISDAVVLSLCDPVLCAIIATVFIGRSRLNLHSRQVKVYIVIVFLVLLYMWGDVGPGEIQVSSPSMMHVYFLIARSLLAVRSAFVKRVYASFNHATIPPDPRGDAMLF